jgi:hypothetical protein
MFTFYVFLYSGCEDKISDNTPIKNILLEKFYSAKDHIKNIQARVYITRNHSSVFRYGWRSQTTFFEADAYTYRYCKIEQNATLSDSGKILNWITDEDHSFSISDDILDKVSYIVSINSIYDDCENLIKNTDFSDISISGDISRHKNRDKEFVLKTNQYGYIIQCDLLDYKIADGPLSKLYSIGPIDEIDRSEEEICTKYWE